jgi:hypothetical protein
MQRLTRARYNHQLKFEQCISELNQTYKEYSFVEGGEFILPYMGGVDVMIELNCTNISYDEYKLLERILIVHVEKSTIIIYINSSCDYLPDKYSEVDTEMQTFPTDVDMRNALNIILKNIIREVKLSY